ncbi:hypothetical protein M431DRAFT_298222 [Trichoderma harzianum CBS 226.95]|uniref:Prion-inhibition and propagation HeLo domain-containing protein n=1 Tax=Trichoderma harzianum CBS 226.95 TaxID=983964 RepID=A0A2T4AQB1_TRIHA|nr:hypothetical protein M431DRAFT_298222 [Trichoderma harzianum CBS 226.95]PTB59254.1 hypothetical protein M431DRAFT_298222 [Trichoderma harzianum CBS 226.95]
MDSTELFTSGRKISNDLLQLVVLFQLRQSPNYRHLVAEEQRFQLWAHSLGLYQQGHASLDYRVRDAEIVKSGFARILEELQTHIENLLAIEHRIPREITPQKLVNYPLQAITVRSMRLISDLMA